MLLFYRDFGDCPMFKRESVRDRYMGHVESHLIHDMWISILGWHLLEGSVYLLHDHCMYT